MKEADLTTLLRAVNLGDQDAYEDLMSRLYDELRRLAGSVMRSERSGHTLQPTALVNEAYMRLAGSSTQWENRGHFFAAAARSMRRILVEHARKKYAQKRGGEAQKVTFADLEIASVDPQVDLLMLDEALQALKDFDERLVKVVELRYFAGCDVQETAKLLEVSPATVKRDWAFARAWLYDYMTEGGRRQDAAGGKKQG